MLYYRPKEILKAMKPVSENMISKVLIIDDHLLVREGLMRVLNREKDLKVCGEAGNAAEALKCLAELQPDLAIVDISLEGSNGLDLAKQMRKLAPKLLILVLSMHKELIHAERALRAGAQGYVMKGENKETLLQAIRHILQGHIYVSKAVSDRMLQTMSSAEDPTHTLRALTDREFEVFRLVGQGYGTRQIAEELTISIKTAESHRERIREKLNLNTTFELVQQAIHWIHQDEPPL